MKECRKMFTNVMCVNAHSRMEINYIKAGYTIISSGLQTQLDFSPEQLLHSTYITLSFTVFCLFHACYHSTPLLHSLHLPSILTVFLLPAHLCPQKLKIKTLTPNGKMTIEVTTPIQLRIRVTVRDELKSV